MRATATALLLGLLISPACTSRSEVPDDELGGLVHPVEEAPQPVDLAKATTPSELLRATQLPANLVTNALGGHVTTIKSATTIVAADKATPADELTVDTVIETAADGTFHSTSNNSADYGDEVIFVGGKLFLRPRYALWHVRKPNDLSEPIDLRNRFASELSAALELLLPGVTIADQGKATVASKAGRKFSLSLAASKATPGAEPLVQRAWRASRTVESVNGEIVLDETSGVVLSATLKGSLSFDRDGRHFTMNLDVTHQVSAIGTAPSITEPPALETVQTPGLRGEVEERDALLKGMAPPQRPSATPDPGATE